DLVQDAALLQLARRLLHHLHVAFRAHHDAHARRVDVDVLELCLHLWIIHQLRHERDLRRAARATLARRRALLPAEPQPARIDVDARRPSERAHGRSPLTGGHPNASIRRATGESGPRATATATR